jgi:hypothetical protein
VEQAINKSLKSGAAIECTDNFPYVITPLTVSKPSHVSLLEGSQTLFSLLMKNSADSRSCRTRSAKALQMLKLDSIPNTFSLEIPLEKITRFKNDIILAMSELNVLTARRLAKITGKIISFIPSYGNICRIMCRKKSI